ncbi:S8 family peptidase [Ammoniphilus resinae]|uniref:S8 family peptidase n=1 Tax=Ammoniphilus resinae TaxID=861532 RepID=UPI001AE45DBC|nr:S8 family peptidase [Ammoniphilus resinae]
MFGYSMVQMVRTHAHKLERPLREQILNLYQPFKWTPCFLHRFFEGSIKKIKKFSVIIEFENDCYDIGCKEVNKIMSRHINNRLKTHFSVVSCCSAEITPNGLEEMLSGCRHIKKVYINREVRALLDVAVPSAHAKNIFIDNTELTGEGVTIAVIDTGIYPHPDLLGRIREFIDLVNGRTEPYDDNGHGTHCAGDAAGNGFASSFKYVGPAPKADLVGIKVLDKLGSGSLDTVMQGVQWCIDYNANPENADKIDIISMSLGSTATYDDQKDDPMVQIVEAAWDAGIVVVVAAGNEGPNKGTVASPGISDKVITVGALDDRDTGSTSDGINRDPRLDDDVAEFSSRGQRSAGVAKPDILAPGVNIVSLRSPNSYLDKLQKSARVDEDYCMLSGTSMATPICAGVVALMLHRDPNLRPDVVKQKLMAGPDLWTGEEFDKDIYGAGYINAERTIRMI